MNTLATILTIATAEAIAPEAADHISGSAITAIFTGMAAVISAIGTKLFANAGFNRRFAAREQELRAEIAEELRTKITNDPLRIEQSSYQAMMKNNEKDHSDIFTRLRCVETEVAGIKATIAAKFDGLSAQMMETREMVRSLYDKVCNGKRK